MNMSHKEFDDQFCEDEDERNERLRTKRLQQKPEPICIGCGKHPRELSEYVEASSAKNYGRTITPDDYVRREEGTYNPANGHFACTTCYCNMGMPSSSGGWIAP